MPRIRSVVPQDEKLPSIGYFLRRALVLSFSAWLLTNRAVRPHARLEAIPLFPPVR